MHSKSFLVAAIAYVALTLFIFFNYPISWRQNRMFVAVLIIWHLLGTVSVVTIFTVYRLIPYEGLRHEVTRIGSCYYITTLLLGILFLIRLACSGAYLFVMHRLGRPIPPNGYRLLTDKRFHAILFLALSYAVFVIGYFNIDFLRATRYEVKIPAAAAEPGLDICLVADIHAGSGTWEYTYQELTERIAEARPDVLLIAGDVFDETTSDADLRNFAHALEHIQTPKYGIYYVYGNHDSYTDDWAAEQLRPLGVTVLEEELAVLGEDIQLIGCMDPKHGAESMEQLFADLAPDPDKPILVLTHRPAHFRELSELGCDLAMAGHTHGFNIPMFLGSNLFGDMYYGRKQYGDMTAITTSGVSGWGFHYKWPAKSEVVSIHLRFEA